MGVHSSRLNDPEASRNSILHHDLEHPEPYLSLNDLQHVYQRWPPLDHLPYLAVRLRSYGGDKAPEGILDIHKKLY